MAFPQIPEPLQCKPVFNRYLGVFNMPLKVLKILHSYMPTDTYRCLQQSLLSSVPNSTRLTRLTRLPLT